MQLTVLPVQGYEKVIQCHDAESGLQAVISIHDTTCGPALGGMRMWPYASLQDAVCDANRLAAGMTYKSAIAETGFGGGKAVILGDARRDKNARLLRAMGRFVHAMGGQYITGEDVGTTVDDMVLVRQETPYVVGLPQAQGSSGDPAPFTALGVFLGMQTCAEWALHSRDLRGMRVAVQGCGNVASHLCQQLYQAGALLTVTDVVPDRAQRLAQQYGARIVPPEAIYEVPCEIYAPCALGGTLNDHTIPRLQCQIVAGSANNQCLREEHGDALQQRGIVYAPDFVINAGGLLKVATELAPEGYDEARVVEKVRHIADTVYAILTLAARQALSTSRTARHLAEHRLAVARQARGHGAGEPSPLLRAAAGYDQMRHDRGGRPVSGGASSGATPLRSAAPRTPASPATRR